jgi:hypothetical protein
MAASLLSTICNKEGHSVRHRARHATRLRHYVLAGNVA